MPHFSRTLLLAASLTLAAWVPCVHAGDSQASLFDQHAGGDLPLSFTLPAETPDREPLAVELLERLAADVEYPDGSHAVTYTGRVDGQPSIFTRIGDELVIDGAVEGDDQDEPATSRSRVRRSFGNEAGLVDHFFPKPAGTSPWPAGADEGKPGTGLQFWIFLHDKSGENNYAKFHNWYIAWWLRDMERTVLPGVPIKVFIRKNIPGITDFDYMQGSQEAQLSDFEFKVTDYLEDIGARPTILAKSMLFVAARPTSWSDGSLLGAFGIALPEGRVSMASGWGPRHVVAHEFGHTLGAEHELAETRTCVTNMKSYTIGFFSCQVYTKENDKRIRAHVKEHLR